MKPTLLLIPDQEFQKLVKTAVNDTNLKKVSGIQTFPASVIVKYFIRPANTNKNTNTERNTNTNTNENALMHPLLSSTLFGLKIQIQKKLQIQKEIQIQGL